MTPTRRSEAAAVLSVVFQTAFSDQKVSAGKAAKNEHFMKGWLIWINADPLEYGIVLEPVEIKNRKSLS